MEARAFVLWGESDLAAMRGRIVDVAARWLDAWSSASPSDLDIEILANEELDRLQGGHQSLRYRSLPSGAAIAFSSRGDASTRIGPWLRGGAVDADGHRPSRILGPLAERFIADLAERLLSSERAGDGSEMSERALEPDPLLRAGSGSIAVEVSLLKDKLTYILNYAGARAFLRGADKVKRMAGKLTALREALTSEPVRIEARLGSAELTLGNLRSIAIGDVLRLDAKLEHTVRLVLDGGEDESSRVLLRGYLGSHKGRRAVRLATN